MLKKGYWITILIILLYTTVLQAQIKPIVSVAYEWDRANVSMNDTIVLLAPFENSYISSQTHDTTQEAGLFLGLEMPIHQNWLWQLGLSYYQTGTFTSTGTIYQFADPSYANLGYSFQLESRRLLVESKLLANYQQGIHPYVLANLGEAANKASDYHETPLVTQAVPMTTLFTDHTNHSFSYSLGAGLDIDATSKLRFGIGYRYIHFGDVALGTSSVQQSQDTLGYHDFHANEFLLQISYII